MKVTKTVEVTVCDVCGNEKRHQDWPCSRCKRDMCDGCEEHFSIDIQHVGKERFYPAGHSSVTIRPVVNQYPPRMCKECAEVVIEGLTVLGLVGTPTELN